MDAAMAQVGSKEIQRQLEAQQVTLYFANSDLDRLAFDWTSKNKTPPQSRTLKLKGPLPSRMFSLMHTSRVYLDVPLLPASDLGDRTLQAMQLELNRLLALYPASLMLASENYSSYLARFASVVNLATLTCLVGVAWQGWVLTYTAPVRLDTFLSADALAAVRQVMDAADPDKQSYMKKDFYL